MGALSSWTVVLALVCAGCGPTLQPVVRAKPQVGEPVRRTPGDEAIAEGFVALGRSEGVTLYRRDGRPGMELAAEAELPASPERVRRLVLDYPAHKSWQRRLSECHILARGPAWLDVYERLSLPVLSDRDYTLRVTWGDDGGVLWTKFVTANHNGPPPVSGVQRVKVHEGTWRLAPLRGGAATLALYRFHLDLESPVVALAGTGQAEGDLIRLFELIRGQLPRYP